MATAKPISSSYQSIATATNSMASLSACSLTAGDNNGGANIDMRSSSSAYYVNGTGSLGRLKYHNKHKSFDASTEELDYSELSQSTHILGRYKSDRFLAFKPDEDRRRRTIIIEKKNDSYGFTLQSYGIHYKRNEEVEMLTYVDYVEYDGPACKAGMREGDVILSINGTDMEKADHKTIVDFIKNCDTRMRMVVLFEDCIRKVDLHMRYLQLQNLLQSKMNELEHVCLRERELLEGKWKTHSLPARKKAITSSSDAESGASPEDVVAPSLGFCRSTLSTEDVTNTTRHSQTVHGHQTTIIPPPAQFMLTYHYLDPAYRYVLRPTTSNTTTKYLVSGAGLQRSPSDHHFILQRAESMETTSASQVTQYHSQQQSVGSTVAATTRITTSKPPAPPPRTCEKHKPPNRQQQQQQQLQAKVESTPQKTQKMSGKHCHGGHSCNPCLGHFRWKSSEKNAAAATCGNGDNVSLDAYDLASPCCDIHCVPSRRRARYHKEHTHKHKHRDRERESGKEQRAARPKSQTHASSSATNDARYLHHHHHHHHNHQTPQQQHQQQSHQHYQQQQLQGKPLCDSHTGSIRSRYFDLASGLASHCSLHSCTSSELVPADSTSYTTSISTDTLFWDPKSDVAGTQSRQHSTKSKQSIYNQEAQTQALAQSQAQTQADHYLNQSIYQQRYHITTTQVQPSQIYPNATYVHKPKSWDNLATKAIGGYGFGYGYLDTITAEPAVKLQIAQQRHSMPRRNPCGRYSTYANIENYAPPPSEFIGELTTTTTTTITAKSTKELIGTPCDCLTKQQQQTLKATQYQLSQSQKMTHQNTCQMGYYSHLPRPTTDVGTSTSNISITQPQQQQQQTQAQVQAQQQLQQPNGALIPDISTVTEITRL